MSLCDPRLRRALIQELSKLSFHALLKTVALLLESMGYEDVELAGRTGFVGRNSAGGFDLSAYKPVPGGRRAVIIQVKQYPARRAVYHRTVDELRGVGLNKSATEVILITTSHFSKSLRESRYASAPLLPVRFIDSERLTELLALYRVGVVRDPASTPLAPARLQLDRTFFADLERRYQGPARTRSGEQQVFEMFVEVRPRKRRA